MGDLEQLARAQQVGPRVADVHQRELGPGPDHGGQRGPGPGQVQVPDGRSGLPDSVLHGVEHVARRQPGFQRLERLDDGRAGLRAAVAHPVGHGEQAPSRVGGVLVLVAMTADVRPRGVPDGQRRRCSWHGRFLSGQVADQVGGQGSPGGELGFGLRQVGRDLARGLIRGVPGQVADNADAGQRHAEPPQPRHQAGPLQLIRPVEPVAGHLVDVRGPQQAERIVEAQGLGREPRGPGERPDRQQFHAVPSWCRWRHARPAATACTQRRTAMSCPGQRWLAAIGRPSAARHASGKRAWSRIRT